MIRLADLCYRHRWVVIGIWAIVFVTIVTFARTYPAEYRADYQTPDAEATKAFDLLDARFSSLKGDSINIVFFSDAGATTPAAKNTIEALLEKLATFPHVASVVSPFAPQGANQIAKTVKTAYAVVNLDRTIDKLANLDADYQKKFLDLVHPGTRNGLQIEVSTFVASKALGAETIALVFAAFILLIAFGSVLAMGLPIFTALFGLGIGAGLGAMLSRVFGTPDWAATVATMIGIGVGVDYALFIVTRYRDGLVKGLLPRTAVITAMATAGRAVLFAGVIVIVSLLGMVTMRLGYMNGMLCMSVVAVAAMLAASLTLLPAILGFIGYNIDRFRIPFVGAGHNNGTRSFWYRWSRIVQRRPWMSLCAGTLIMLVITAPISWLRFGFPDDGNNPETETSRRAYDLMTAGFGPGFNGPLLMVVDTQGAGNIQRTLVQLFTKLQQLENVAFVLPPIFNPAGDTAIINVYPASKPQSKQTVKLVNTLRQDIVPEIIAGTGIKVLVGGFTAISIDHADYILGRLPLFIATVVLLSFVLLIVVFRSPLVAFKAGIMNLLSIAAAYGVMSYAVNGTWLGQLLNIPETPVPAFVPMIMFAILFGLSMDYEVFLLSSIREQYIRTGDNSLAVADGLTATARVITAAAAIMVFVFGVFIFDPNVFIKQIGLGLASAILIDATVIRIVLVPATMELLGKANWWMPRWLNRILPEIKGAAAIEAELAALLAKESTNA
ncbi:MAG: MMPL family transporter [Verrucomicrobia bacterium]|nr:MMPL family transporter [Verrucomicrobiota bacterium]MBU1735482.1 MMPL family transporter [Verrucomicrobiota bacterium]MBU1856877.1 MMPL family transporter [Verrucomicrobiota bacterium]